MTDATTQDVPAKAIEAAAGALWGELWQSAMARTLNLNLRTVQRIAAAAREDQTYRVSRTLLATLLAQLERKHRPLQRAYEDLKLLYDGA